MENMYNPVLAGHNPQDMIFSKFLSMYQCMSCSTNEHVKCISKMAKIDARSLINNNLQTIARQWHINIQDLIDGVPVPKLIWMINWMMFRSIIYYVY